jgi:hypothetical protein
MKCCTPARSRRHRWPPTSRKHHSMSERAAKQTVERAQGARAHNLLTLLGRVSAKADQPGFVRVQRQFELAHSLLEIVKERLCLVLMLPLPGLTAATRNVTAR